jgi:hypothetical protein
MHIEKVVANFLGIIRKAISVTWEADMRVSQFEATLEENS